MMLETVMVVDDVDLVTKSIRRMLAPVRVVGTTRGRDAVALARAERPQLALVDLYIPDLFGLDVVAELRKEDPSITIGVISGMLDVPLAMECVRASVSWFIEKPFNREQLVDAIVKGGAPFTVPSREPLPRLDYAALSPPVAHQTPAPDPAGVASSDLSLEAVKRKHVQSVLASTGGNHAEAAKRLRISRSTLRNILARERRASE